MDNTLRKAAEMALDVLLNEYALGTERNPSPYDTIKALESALAQDEPDWTTDTPVPPFKYLDFAEYKGTGESVKIKHTLAPPIKPWVSLTDEEVHEAAIKCVKSGQSVNAAIRAIEAALRSKNNG